MSLFLADGAPGMSCVTTPRLAAAVGRIVWGGGITMHPSRQDAVGLGTRAPDTVSALPA